MSERQVVHRIEDGMDRQEVAATTYQMRNFYTQFRDGFFSRLDVFNYASHHQIARWAGRAPAGTHLLDVCCGRGLLLPLLRYGAKDLGSYTGIDIRPENATWTRQRVTDGRALRPEEDSGYYPWPTHLVVGNVAYADSLIEAAASDDEAQPDRFGFIVYTASIEHMHPDGGRLSLHALRRLAAPGATLVLTCPNTPEGQDGYDTRYRAHVYEWKLSELREALAMAGWHVREEWAVDAGISEVQAWADTAGLGDHVRRARRFVPQEWVAPALAAMLPPELAAEVGLLCSAEQATESLF